MVGGEGDVEEAGAGDEEVDDGTDGTRWITEQRMTGSGVDSSSGCFCVDKLMSCCSGRMLVGSLRMISAESSLVFGESQELVMVGGVGGYSLRCACVKMKRDDPLP